jgi:hypothetical protein
MAKPKAVLKRVLTAAMAVVTAEAINLKVTL